MPIEVLRDMTRSGVSAFAAGTGGGALLPWVPVTDVALGEPRTLTMADGVVVLMVSNSARTTGATLSLAELGNWTYFAQSKVLDFPANQVVLEGYQMTHDNIQYQSDTTRLTSATFTPAEQVVWQGPSGTGQAEAGTVAHMAVNSTEHNSAKLWAPSVLNDALAPALVANIAALQLIDTTNLRNRATAWIQSLQISALFEKTAIAGDIAPTVGGGFWQLSRHPVDDNNNAFSFGAAPQGGAASLAARINTIGNFASPNAGGIVSGSYYDNSFQGTASATLAGAANRMDIAAFFTSVPLSINQIGVGVTTGVAGAQVKILIYETGDDGWPSNKLYESAALSAAATAYVFEALAFTFQSGRTYWVGVRHSATATLKTISVSSACNYGLTSNNSTTYANVLRKTLAFATVAPASWGFVAADLVAATPPSIRFRAA